MKKGWIYKKLGEVFPIVMGKTPPRNIAKFWDVKKETRNLWVSITDLSKYEGKEIHETKEYISDEGKQNIKLIPKGSLLVSFKLTLGKMAFAGEDLYTNEAIISLPKREDIDLMFLYYYFSYIDWNKIASGNEKVKGKTLNKSSLSVIPIPVLPLSEQRAIVSRLDSAFSKIDSLKANAEKQVSEARALFQKALEKAMEPKEGWEEKKMGEICEVIRGKRFVRADIVEKGIPCIHYGDIYTSYGLSVTKTLGCITSELAKKMRFAKKNDVVVVQAGENNWDIGVGVAYLGEEPAAVHDACFILKHNQNPMYISYYLRSYNYHRYLVDYVHEGKICSFLKPALENAPFPLPPLSTQHRIVEHLDSLSAHVKQLEKNQQKVIAECDSLKQSILRSVFEE